MCNDKRWQSLRKVLSLVEKELRIFHCFGNASAQPILFTALDFGPGTLLLLDISRRSKTLSEIIRVCPVRILSHIENFINPHKNVGKIMDEFYKSSSASFYSKVLNEEWLNNVLKLLTASSFRYLSVVIEDISIVSAWNWPIAWSNAVSWHWRMSLESQGSWLDSFECTRVL